MKNIYGIEDKTIVKENVFIHLSPSKNRLGIGGKGLLVDQKPSGYGKTPAHSAVYLSVHQNLDTAYDLLTKWEEFDVWEVRLKDDDVNLFVADEDSDMKTWKSSIKKFGTLAYKGSIPPDNLKLIATISSHKVISKTK